MMMTENISTVIELPVLSFRRKVVNYRKRRPIAAVLS